MERLRQELPSHKSVCQMSPVPSMPRSVSPPERPAHIWERTGADQVAPWLVEWYSGLPPAVLTLPIACGAVTYRLPCLSLRIVGSPRPDEEGSFTGVAKPF